VKIRQALGRKGSYVLAASMLASAALGGGITALVTTGQAAPVALTAATSSAASSGSNAVSPPKLSTPKGAPRKGWMRMHAMMGATRGVANDVRVVSDSSSGGLFGQGELVVASPSGVQRIYSLSNTTKAFGRNTSAPKTTKTGKERFAAPFVKVAATSIPTGEIVVVRGAEVEKGQAWASTIIETGFEAAS
jgi:hypothetical protein